LSSITTTKYQDSCRDSKVEGSKWLVSYHGRMDTRAARSQPSRRPKPGDGIPVGLLLGGGSLVHQVARELSTALDRQLAPFDLTAQQAALLLRAARQETSPSQLKALLGTDTAGMTRLLDRLEAKGLLNRRRHPEDRRSIVIELTEQARALVPRVAPIFRRVNGQLLAGFAEPDVQQLTTTLQRMLDNLRGTDTDPQV
jgi:DNA-binding MarR family transcriptional regulator